jgi:hypothetical protein
MIWLAPRLSHFLHVLDVFLSTLFKGQTVATKTIKRKTEGKRSGHYAPGMTQSGDPPPSVRGGMLVFVLKYQSLGISGIFWMREEFQTL